MQKEAQSKRPEGITHFSVIKDLIAVCSVLGNALPGVKNQDDYLP